MIKFEAEYDFNRLRPMYKYQTRNDDESKFEEVVSKILDDERIKELIKTGGVPGEINFINDPNNPSRYQSVYPLNAFTITNIRIEGMVMKFTVNIPTFLEYVFENIDLSKIKFVARCVVNEHVIKLIAMDCVLPI